MVDLTEYRNKNLTYEALNGEIKLPLRPYLGMSQLGHSCDRFLFYYFNWCFKDKTTKRMLELWKRGHREEDAIIERLEKIGIFVYGRQIEHSHADGTILGHNDGLCIGVKEAPKTVHIAEFKTIKDSEFKKLKKLGCVEKWKPSYHIQQQIYMYKAGLKRAFFYGVNKNDDDIWVERTKIDPSIGKNALKRGERIISLFSPPPRPFPSTWWECKYCSAYQICHLDGKFDKNCRTCKYVLKGAKGEWFCDLGTTTLHWRVIDLTTSQQRKACNQYVFNKHLKRKFKKK